MAKTQEELNQLKVEYETLNNKLKELTEDELKQVTGGNDTTTYKYVFTDRDFVYENAYKTIIIAIEQNISTNDDYEQICCRQINRGSIESIDSASGYAVAAKRLVDYYTKYGGSFNAM